jgi:hypothetical protein
VEIPRPANGRQSNTKENFTHATQQDDETWGAHSQDGGASVLFKRTEQAKHGLIRGEEEEEEEEEEDDDDDNLRLTCLALSLLIAIGYSR